MSAFGGIVALTAPVSEAVAAEMVGNAKADVLIAPSFDDAALELFAPSARTCGSWPPRPDAPTAGICARSAAAGWSRTPTCSPTGRDEWRVVTKAQPTEDNWRDMELAWRVCAWVKSNAIVLAAGGMAVGIGGGQQNRVTPGEIATARAAVGPRAAPRPATPSSRSGTASTRGRRRGGAVIQPGGSVRDDEVIAAADEHGLVMVFTGERQFQH
jgi:phosphoribosylaminoimidazolecarboxamide formyltransferase/IMP cyclohydrolase